MTRRSLVVTFKLRILETSQMVCWNLQKTWGL